MREAEVDRDPAQLLFRQTIRIGAGQGFDQRALSMIDVAGGGDDEVLDVGHRQRGLRRNGAQRVNHVAVLARKNRPQVELDDAAHDVTDYRDRLHTKAADQVLG